MSIIKERKFQFEIVDTLYNKYKQSKNAKDCLIYCRELQRELATLEKMLNKELSGVTRNTLQKFNNQ